MGLLSRWHLRNKSIEFKRNDQEKHPDALGILMEESKLLVAESLRSKNYIMRLRAQDEL